MSGLSMKRFSGQEEGSQSNNLDFSSLESNPNYKPESGENSGEGSGESSSAQEAQTQEQVDNTSENTQEQTQNTEVNTSTSSSSTNTEVNPEVQQSVNTSLDENSIFKQLSEKLGREIKSYEDLTTTVNVAPELDPQVKLINEWKEKTGRPVEDFFKFQKDYSKVSDADIAREFLQIEYPTFTAEEINLELESMLPSEDDLDSEIAKKSLELKKYAIKGREILETLKQDLGEPSSNLLTPEIKQKLELVDQIQSQIEASKVSQNAYDKMIEQVALSNSGLKLNLDDNLSIDFKLSDEDKKGIPTLINEMPHWRNEDGSWNHQSVVEDAIKIKYFDAMIKLAYEQGLNSGVDDVLKTAKNSTLGNNPNTSGTEQGLGSKKPIIEDIDTILGKQTLKMKFGNR